MIEMQRAVHIRGRLTYIESSRVQIIELESAAPILVCACGKLYREPVVAVVLIACAMIGYIGIWRFRIRKQIVCRLCHEEVEWVSKEHIGVMFSFHVDARNARRTERSDMVVVSRHPLGEDRIVEVYSGCVSIDSCSVAKTAVDSPLPHINRNNFVIVVTKAVSVVNSFTILICDDCSVTIQQTLCRCRDWRKGTKKTYIKKILHISVQR